DAFRNRDDIIAVGNVEGGIVDQEQSSGGGVEGELGRPAEPAGDKLIGEEVLSEDAAAGDGLIEDAVSQFALDQSILFIESLISTLQSRRAGPRRAFGVEERTPGDVIGAERALTQLGRGITRVNEGEHRDASPVSLADLVVQHM